MQIISLRVLESQPMKSSAVNMTQLIYGYRYGNGHWHVKSSSLACEIAEFET